LLGFSRPLPPSKAEHVSDPHRLRQFFLSERIGYLRRRQIPRHGNDDDPGTAVFEDSVAQTPGAVIA